MCESLFCDVCEKQTNFLNFYKLTTIYKQQKKKRQLYRKEGKNEKIESN